MNIHLDYESFSAADIKLGAFRYASDKSTEILMMGLAFGDKSVGIIVPERLRAVEDFPSDDFMLEELDYWLEDPATVIYAHNAQFEMAVTMYQWKRTFPGVRMPHVEQWRCTKALARRAGLRNRLAEVGADLRLEIQKDKDGTRLIKKFSIPQKPSKANGQKVRWMPWDDSKDFLLFCDYCKTDVVVERDVERSLEKFELKGDILDTFKFDSRCNARGVPVDVPALLNAQKIVAETEVKFADEFREITGFNPTQIKKLLPWLKGRGYTGANLTAPVVEDAMADESWGDHPTRRALELKSYIGFAAVKKIDAMLNSRCPDDRVRGTLQFYGASTGRWSGQIAQFQNVKRSTKDSQLAYDLIRWGCNADDLTLVFGNPIEVISCAVRHFVRPETGEWLQADYAAVECRIVAWLAGQQDLLDQFKKGRCAYSSLASRIFAPMTYETIKAENGDERFVGKQATLGCGFGMGPPKFIVTCKKFGKDVDLELAKLAVQTFRKVNYKIAALWRKFESAARSAINEPGKWWPAGDKCKFAVVTPASSRIPTLFLKLPSGRMLAYPHPRIEKCVKFGKRTDQITFYGSLENTQWGRASTYGGKLVENATQAVAADIMANGAVKAEQAGFEIATLIHDEALAFESSNELTLEKFCACLCDLPPWADGLPIVAEGKKIPYYLK